MAESMSEGTSKQQSIAWCNFHLPCTYRKIPKSSDAKNPCCNLLKIQTKRANLRVFCQKDANGIANSEDPDQTAPLGAD